MPRKNFLHICPHTDDDGPDMTLLPFFSLIYALLFAFSTVFDRVFTILQKLRNHGAGECQALSPP